MVRRVRTGIGVRLFGAGIAIGGAAAAVGAAASTSGSGNPRGVSGPSLPAAGPITPPSLVPGQKSTGPLPNPSLMDLDDVRMWDEKIWVSWWETNRDAVIKRVMAKRAAGTTPAAAAGADKKLPPERARAAAALMKATYAERPALRAAAAVSLGQMRQADALDRLIEMGRKDPETCVRGMAWLAVGLVGGPDAEKASLPVRWGPDAIRPQPPQWQPLTPADIRKLARDPKPVETLLARQKAPINIPPVKDMFEATGAVMGIGMLGRPGEPALQRLRGLIPRPEVAEDEAIGRAAVWALREAHNPADHDLLVSLVRRVPEEFKATGFHMFAPLQSDALLALGVLRDARDLELLATVSSDGRFADALSSDVVTGGAPLGGLSKRDATSVHPGGAAAQRMDQLWERQQRASADSKWVLSNIDRVSATLALGPDESGRSPVAGNIQVQNALIQNFAPYLNQGGPIFGGASVIALAVSDSRKGILLLRDLLEMSPDPVFAGPVHPKSALRGYAAIGIGLYLANGGTAKIETRPVGTVTVGVNPNLPDYLDLNETLAVRFANVSESSDLRAACAMALGLSGDPANAQRLLNGVAKIQPGDDMLLGYTALAMAMLKDPSAFDVARPLISSGATKLDAEAIAARGVGHLWDASSTPKAPGTPAPTPFDPPAVPQGGAGMAGVLGRRAALLGLSILNDPRSESLLAGAWGRDEATVQDVARGMGWCHAYKTADALTQVVERDQKGAVEAAMSLGWVFDPDHPSRLSKMVVGNNYHEWQSEWAAGHEASFWKYRNFLRVGDSYLYSTPLGSQVVRRKVKPTPATRPATYPTP